MDVVIAHLPGILLSYSVLALGLLSPGPNILAILGVAMDVGRRAGVAMALGVALGSTLWAALTALGLSALLAAYAGALIVIKIAGGLYLLWLAFKALRSASRARHVAPTDARGAVRPAWRYAAQGLLIQMTNPKAALSWVAIVALGVGPEAPGAVFAVIVIGAAALSTAGHLAYALLFSTPPMLRAYARARRWIQAALGAFFAFAGIKLLLSRS